MMKDKIGTKRITKTEWYNLGGFANSNLFRKQAKSGAWQYYQRVN